MGNNRYNKPIPDFTPKADRQAEKAVVLLFSNCCVCGEKIDYGFFGRWGDGGTCSRHCEVTQQAKPKDFGEPK